MHDLRRTFTTAMTLLNVHAFTISHLMKHSTTSSMTLSYAPPTHEQLREALIAMENHVLESVRAWESAQATSRSNPEPQDRLAA
jgi:integrase